MKAITTVSKIQTFASRLAAAGIEIPDNISIVCRLPEKSYRRIVPKEFRGFLNVEYNTHAGIKINLEQQFEIDDPQK